MLRKGTHMHGVFGTACTAICAVVVSCVCAAGSALALENAQYPTRPIRMIMPQAPGSATDTIARVIAAELTRQMGQQVVVDNRPGGAFTIGMELTARAAPDGYTLGYAPIGALAIGPHIAGKVSFDVRKDFEPISQTAKGQMLLATSPSWPFKTVRDVIEYARQNPGKLSNASSGNGTPGHVGFELFKSMTGTRIVHVPYKGGIAGIGDLNAGQVQLMMESTASITPHAKAGRVRGLAVTGARRSDALPELPTVAEAGVPGYEASVWHGVVAPAGISKALVARLNAEIGKALESSIVRERFVPVGIAPTPSTPQQFGELIRTEYVKWSEVVKRSGATID